MLGTFLMLLNA